METLIILLQGGVVGGGVSWVWGSGLSWDKKATLTCAILLASAIILKTVGGF